MKNEFFTSKKVPKIKNRRQQLPMPNDIHEYLMNADEMETETAIENSQEELIIGQNSNVRHLCGKYERYSLCEDQKRLVKDIVTIYADGKVIVRSMEGIQKGVASYFMNSILAINLNTLNDKDAISTHLLMYVGRFEYKDIECLHAVCSTINSHNIPLSRHEVLIPTKTLGILSEIIQIESQAFYKLNYKYPQLLKSLQARPLLTSNRISW
ncbi:hypothetical protein [Runella salmonicolor]|uniref:Uncharacterized protein n=1 Tax=Runella salmonicolor TaxID=2950278 RepID=A0ABT1FNV2_9BACT|nr:hypothetical protein [Runella salmonicolor]MCP1382187.1 hypothetical protein [Runella salmonicolor]